MDLNASQHRAVVYDGGHLLIVAGPGTGKTHTLTRRIIHRIPKLSDGQKVLAITFTHKAAEEMRRRLSHGYGDIDRYVTVGTFHRFCLEVLRGYGEEARLPPDFKVAGREDIERAGKLLWPDQKGGRRKDLLNFISRWKAVRFQEEMPDEVSAYNKFLRAEGMLDFDDLLLETVALFQKRPDILQSVQKHYQDIFVDEYQDINAAQHVLLKNLVGEHGHITAIGDPNQAIYGFRGADARYFREFTEDFQGAGILSLSENYRSAKTIVTASAQMIAQQASPQVPTLTARLYLQGCLTVFEAASDRAEAEYVVHTIEKMVGGTSMFSHDSGRAASSEEAGRGFGDIAVLYRLHSQHTALKEAFERSGIPYHVSGRAKDEPEDEVCPSLAEEPTFSLERVLLMTLHAAKGLEFPCVFIVGCEYNILPLSLEGMTADPSEERRLFYVGMTRAKEQLFLTHAKRRCLYGKRTQNAPSVFLRDIKEDLKNYVAAVQRKKKPTPDEEQLNLFG